MLCTEGTIIVATVKDDKINLMSVYFKKFFRDLGSKLIQKVKNKFGYVFIGVVGQNDKMNEKVASKLQDKVSLTQIFDLTSIRIKAN